MKVHFRKQTEIQKEQLMDQSISLKGKPNFLIDEDQRLVSAAQQNPAEFKQLYLKWLKPVYRYFYFRMGNVKDAEDLTSQVFLKVYEALPRYRNRGSFPAWLFTIAHSRAVDHYRKGSREIAIEELESTPDSSDLFSNAVHNSEIEELLSLLKGLSKDEQRLICLRFMAGLTYREIGQILHRKEDAVRKSISRLLSRIKIQMEVNHD